MVFEEVERLQREYTDKYVEVDAKRPELARFADYTGIVKTINYNGRALVEFLDYNQNIGWYDIGLDYLKIVPKPDPNAKKEKAAKAAPVAKAATAKAADAKPVRKPVVGSKLSNKEILAALKAKGPGAITLKAAPVPTAEPTAAAAAPAPAPVEKAAPKKAAAKPAAGGAKPTTTADKIAWCRANDGKG